MSRPAVRRDAGLTLVELMVVGVVAAIVLALAAPSFTDMIARQRVRSINTELLTDLRYARTEALQRKEKIAVVFESDDAVSCYSVYNITTAGVCWCLGNSPHCDGLAIEMKRVVVPRSSTVTITAPDGRPEIIFDPDRGLTDQTEAFVVDVQSSRSGHLATSVNRLGQGCVASPDRSIAGIPASCSSGQ